MNLDRALLITLAVAFAAYVTWRELPRAAADKPDIAGIASVIDGDTIVIHGTHIRLSGIDAPESGQHCADGAGVKYLCGQKAAFALANMLAQHSVTCRDQGQDRYGRTLGRCFLGASDVQAALVRAGWAIAYRRYSQDYVGDEEAAHAAKAGIWSGTFVEPEIWRHDKTARD